MFDLPYGDFSGDLGLISDFGVGDEIDLSGLYSGVLNWVGSADLAALGDVNFQNGKLSANLDTDGAAEFSVAITLTGLAVIDSSVVTLNG